MLIVGSGPHALTMSRYLACAGASATVLADDGWCERWQARMERLDVGMLRSHHTQHPEPDHYALARFGGDPVQAWAGPWSTPTTDVFERFCGHLVATHALDTALVRDRALRIVPMKRGLRVLTQAGREYRARRVVLATNAMRPVRPGWSAAAAGGAPRGRIVHSDELDLRDLRLAGERILVVGGGLTAAGIAAGAVRRGARVVLVARRPLAIRVADAESNWHGPARLRPYFAEPDPERRLEMSSAARSGGTITPALAWELRDAVQAGSAELLEGHEVACAAWQDGAFGVVLDGEPRRCDRIWLATGHELSVAGEPLLHDVTAARPARIVGGRPVLDEACRWPGTELHLMGALAELQLGPLARNLAGARMAADRIVSCVEPRARAEYARPAAPVS